jgi:ribosomal protein S7
MEKNKEIKNKIISLLMLDGKKKTGEKIILKSLKEIQKNSSKSLKKIIQLALIYTLPTFKIHEISNKKQKKRKNKIKKVPAFIPQTKTKISLAIKIILTSTKKNVSKTFNRKLNQEILLNAKNKGFAINIKNELQQQVLINKHYLSYYRWC